MTAYDHARHENHWSTRPGHGTSFAQEVWPGLPSRVRRLDRRIASSGKPGRNLCQDVALSLHLLELPAQPGQLGSLICGQTFLPGKGLPASRAAWLTQFAMVCAVTLNSLDSSAGVRPALASSNICWRNSGGSTNRTENAAAHHLVDQ